MRQLNKIKIGEILLAHECEKCMEGAIETDDAYFPCGECEGLGWVITADGCNLAKFIRLISK